MREYYIVFGKIIIIPSQHLLPFSFYYFALRDIKKKAALSSYAQTADVRNIHATRKHNKSNSMGVLYFLFSVLFSLPFSYISSTVFLLTHEHVDLDIPKIPKHIFMPTISAESVCEMKSFSEESMANVLRFPFLILLFSFETSLGRHFVVVSYTFFPCAVRDDVFFLFLFIHFIFIFDKWFRCSMNRN